MRCFVPFCCRNDYSRSLTQPGSIIPRKKYKVIIFDYSTVNFRLYAFFWVIPRRLKFICRRFGTLFHLHRQVGARRILHAPTCLLRWNRVFRNVGIYISDAGESPKESIQHSVHGESLKSSVYFVFFPRKKKVLLTTYVPHCIQSSTNLLTAGIICLAPTQN